MHYSTIVYTPQRGLSRGLYRIGAIKGDIRSLDHSSYRFYTAPYCPCTGLVSVEYYGVPTW